MYSTTPINVCRSPFSNANIIIPSTNYTHTTSVEASPQQQNAHEAKEITIELQVQGWYKLYVEPIRGYPPVTMDEDYIVSPKFPYHFKLPLSLFTIPSSFPMASLCRHTYVTKELAQLRMSLGLAQYLQPYIVQSAFEFAQRNPNTELKLVFDVKAAKIDLANHLECDSYL